MINFRINRNGDLQVSQRDTSPTVYLDHWALCEFSESQPLGVRFTTALELGNGTLALSWLNLAEFTKITMKEQAHKTENFIEKILPRVFFLEVEPFTVIRRENDLLGGGQRRPPHADIELLKAFVRKKPTSVNLLTAHDLFSIVQTSQLARRLDDLADSIVSRIEALRHKLDTSPEFQLAVKRPPSGRQIQRGTRFILRELVRTLLTNKGIRMTRNQAIDLLHAVVPVAYCDFVLLDKHWQTQVDRVRSRLSQTGVLVPIGRVFSGKGNGVDRFLSELESS
jgi:hypothetical protein